jgi:DNA-binding beta-propeller fold protein YncE
VYNLPITATSVPAFRISNGLSSAPMLAVDAAGNLYVGDEVTETVSVYAPPFSAASAPAVVLTFGVGYGLRGIAIGR